MANWLQPEHAQSENGSGLDCIHPLRTELFYLAGASLWSGGGAAGGDEGERVDGMEIHLSEGPGE